MKGKPIKTPIQPHRLNPPVKMPPASETSPLKPASSGEKPVKRERTKQEKG